MDPSRTSLGKQALRSTDAVGGGLFWLVLVPSMLACVALLSYPGTFTNWLAATLSSVSWLRYAATATLLVLLQQIVFVLAFRCRVWVRLLISVAAALAAGRWLTTAQAALGLLPLFVIALLVVYRAVSGALDHSMALYATALGTTPVRSVK